MKFHADIMLGKLSKWMRIFGYDVTYSFKSDENLALLDKALSEGRVVLTRKKNLKDMTGSGKYYFVAHDRVIDQLEEVLFTYNLKISEHLFSRCIRCNEMLETIEKDDVKNIIPAYVFSTQEKFKQCKTCKKVYWNATHRKNMEDKIKKITGKLKSSA